MDRTELAKAHVHGAKANISAAIHVLSAASTALTFLDEDLVQPKLADADRPFVALTDTQIEMLLPALRSYQNSDSLVDPDGLSDLITKAEAEHYDRRF
jgi:hypothetical protein